ncbi:helix-turn-helix protein [Paramicrobacterium agarici]|nr:helix-turn-helix protein [Microbacterium agarici]
MDAATMVRRVRAMTGITRKEIAELADLSPSTIGRIERGTLDPTWSTLSQILESTGYRISGDTIVSAGDPSAIVAARSVLRPLLEPYRELSGALFEVMVPVAETTKDVARGVRGSAPAVSTAVAAPIAPIADMASEVRCWLTRWERAGWLSPDADTENLVSLAVSAGNAAKFSRRSGARTFVVAEDGWRALARRLGEYGIEYAVSGIIAARADRSTSGAANPVIYVNDPAQVLRDLDLVPADPCAGILLISPENDELSDVQTENGICFVTRSQAILDAFAGFGREPDKAESSLRDLLVANA